MFDINKVILEINTEIDKMFEDVPATSTADIRGVSAEQAPHIDWKSGGGPETNLGKRRMKKKDAIVRRVMNGSTKMSSTK
jgi:hypothetical protein